MGILIELIKRLGTKTPYFFTVLKYLSIIIAVITGLPLFIANSGIDLPDAWDAVVSKTTAIAATVGALIAQLTTTTEDKKKEGIED